MLHTSIPRLSNPLLQSHVEMLDSALQPLANVLSGVSPFMGAALFVKDNYYENSASTVSLVNASDLHSEDLEFIETTVRGHRIDLTATTLGRTFLSHESKLEKSKVTPRHLTWGIYTEPQPGRPVVLQLIFDQRRASFINEQIVASYVQPLLKDVWLASQFIVNESLAATSLADELMLDVPATPNAYALKWDGVGSSGMVDIDYAVYRHYLQQFGLAVSDLADKYGARITSYQGDSQDIIVNIPDYVDKADLYSVGNFGWQVVVPFARHIRIVHDAIAARYRIHPEIRVAVGLGYVEQLQTSQVTGPVLWEVGNLLKNKDSDNDQLHLNRAAQEVLGLKLDGSDGRFQKPIMLK